MKHLVHLKTNSSLGNSLIFLQHDSQEFLQYVLEGLHNEMNRSEQPPPKKKEAAKKPEVKKEAEEQNGNGNPDEKPEVNGEDDNAKVMLQF